MKRKFYLFNSCVLTLPTDCDMSLATIDGLGFLGLELDNPIDTDIYRVGDELVLSLFGNANYNGTTYIKQIVSATVIVTTIRILLPQGSPGKVQLYSNKQVHPRNFLSTSFEWEKEQGQVFYRKKLSGKIALVNDSSTGIDDFTYMVGSVLGNQCCRIKLAIHKLCSGVWEREWVGSFAHTDVEWDMHRCRAEVQPEVVDQYTCLLNNTQQEINLIQIPGEQTVTVTDDYNLEFCVDTLTPCQNPSATVCIGEGFTPWWSNDDPGTLPCDATVRIYARMFMFKNCIAGECQPPDAGWTQVEDDCEASGRCKYVKDPTEFPALADVAVSGCIDGIPYPPITPGNWVLIVPNCEGDPLCTTLEDLCAANMSLWWSRPDTGTDYTRNRNMEDVLLFAAQRTCPRLANVVSDFFEINPIGDAPGYVAGQNYVTSNNGAPYTNEAGDASNQVSSLQIGAKSDVKNPTATQPATRANFTLNKLLENLRSMFNVHWFVDDNDYLRIEHISFFNRTEELDLTVPPNNTYDPRLTRKQFSYKKYEMPEREKFTFMEADGDDFEGRPIIYNSPCITPGQEQTYAAEIITTDINYIRSAVDGGDGDDISNDGFVIFCADGAGLLRKEVGLITNELINNGHLSWANLHFNYHRHYRVLLSGNMNGIDTEFFTARPFRQQKGLSLPWCCRDLDPENTFVTTALGEGVIEKASENNKDNTITLEVLLNEVP